MWRLHNVHALSRKPVKHLPVGTGDTDTSGGARCYGRCPLRIRSIVKGLTEDRGTSCKVFRALAARICRQAEMFDTPDPSPDMMGYNVDP